MTIRDRLYSTCREIISELVKCPNAHLFFWPVNPEADGAPGYYEQVSLSMSFYQIQENLDNNKYTNPDEFVNDLMLIWRNAKSFNDENHLVHRTADALAKKAQILVSLLPHYYTEDEKDSGLHRYVEMRINRYKLWKKSHL